MAVRIANLGGGAARVCNIWLQKITVQFKNFFTKYYLIELLIKNLSVDLSVIVKIFKNGKRQILFR